MMIRTYPLLVVVTLATACARPDDAPASAVGDQGEAAEPVSEAQATAGKPLIHVWKSPT